METNIFEEIGKSKWLEEVASYQRTTINNLLEAGLSHEQAAEIWLGRTGAGTNAPFGTATAGPSLFQNLKKEINKLVCGDPQYEDLRNRVSETWSKHHSGTVMMIAAAIGSVIGVAAVILVPAVGLLIAVVARVGVSTWCNAKAA